ncbi:MAG: hypothetical protein V1796_09600 [Pseudomonadota bacterium]
MQRPELFKCIILLDAPILGYFKGTAFGMFKRLGLVDRITPASAARERRPRRCASLWPSCWASADRCSATQLAQGRNRRLERESVIRNESARPFPITRKRQGRLEAALVVCRSQLLISGYC